MRLAGGGEIGGRQGRGSELELVLLTQRSSANQISRFRTSTVAKDELCCTLGGLPAVVGNFQELRSFGDGKALPRSFKGASGITARRGSRKVPRGLAS